MSNTRIKWPLILTVLIIALYAVFLIPETPTVVDTSSSHVPFVWGRDDY